MPEPIIYPVRVDMSSVTERQLIEVGNPVHSIQVVSLAAGTTLFEVKVGDNPFIRLQVGDTLELGSCYPTLRGVRVRSAPALAGLFSELTIGGTPQTGINL